MNKQNVVAFKPPRREVLALADVELRLGDDFSIEMRLCGDAGDVVAVLEYSLTAKSPETFDLDVLREAWVRWRQGNGVAS
jgi:hypothetical protein